MERSSQYIIYIEYSFPFIYSPFTPFERRGGEGGVPNFVRALKYRSEKLRVYYAEKLPIPPLALLFYVVGGRGGKELK